MKILYIANHNQSNSNDDEGAIAYALKALGHDVVECMEYNGHLAASVYHDNPVDLLLFHKWDRPDRIAKIQAKVKAFWYFDLVEYPDATLEARNLARRNWMERTMPIVDIGFCTDGDWVTKNHGRHNLVWLPQGADERYIGFGKVEKCAHCSQEHRPIDILVTAAVKNCGKGRQDFYDYLTTEFEGRVHWVEKGVHGRALADLVAKSKVVVCPDQPVTDRYWSNRIYLLAGFGAFLLHPAASQLQKFYTQGVDYYSYKNRSDLIDKITVALKVSPSFIIRSNALERTRQINLYRHRCVELINKVEALQRKDG